MLVQVHALLFFFILILILFKLCQVFLMLEILSLQFQPDLCRVNLPTVQFNIMGLALYHPYHPHSYQELELQPFMIIHSGLGYILFAIAHKIEPNPF